MPQRESDELHRYGISLNKKIGSGSFATVYSGVWKTSNGTIIKVAVKSM